MTIHLRERIDQARLDAKDRGERAPLCLSNNMVRALDKLFRIDPEKTEEFIRNHPSPFGD